VKYSNFQILGRDKRPVSEGEEEEEEVGFSSLIYRTINPVKQPELGTAEAGHLQGAFFRN
jgi:hypothetical protein